MSVRVPPIHLGPLGVLANVARVNGSDVPLGTGKYTTNKELELTRVALDDALEQMHALQDQVSVVDSLQVKLTEQDDVITRLKAKIGSKEEQASSDTKSDQELKELRGKLADAEAQIAGQKEAEQKAVVALQQQMQEQETSLGELKMQLEETGSERSKKSAETEAAKMTAQETAGKLAAQVKEHQKLEAELEALGKAAQKEAAGARGKGPKGEMNLKQAQQLFRQMTDEVKKLRTSLATEESALQANQVELKDLEEKRVKQASALEQASKDLEALKKCMAEKEEDLKALRGVIKKDSKLAELKAMLSEEISAKEGAMAAEKKVRTQVQELTSERDKAAGECKRLQILLATVESRNTKQNQCLLDLEEELRALSDDVKDTQQMREDLSISKKALKKKEDELSNARAQLRVALEREGDMQAELVGAHEGMIRLQTMLGDMNTTNHKLIDSLTEMDNDTKANQEKSAEAAIRLDETEKQLASLSTQVLNLNKELGAKARMLSEAGEKLKAAASREASQLSRIDELDAELEQARKGGAQLEADGKKELVEVKQQYVEQQELITTLELELQELRVARTLAEEEFRKLEAARSELRGDPTIKAIGVKDDGNVGELRRMLASMAQDNNELVNTLEASVKQDLAQKRSADAPMEKPPPSVEDVARLEEKEKLLVQAAADKKKADAEAADLRTQLAMLSNTLERERKEAAEAKAAAEAAAALPPAKELTSAIQGDTQLVYRMLQEEIKASNELLLKAGEMVRAAALAAEAAESIAPVAAVPEESIREMVNARDKALSFQMKANALKIRIQSLEQVITQKDVQLKSILDIAKKGGSIKTKLLTDKLQELAEENTILKSSAAEHEQRIGQSKKYLLNKFQNLVAEKTSANGQPLNKRKRVKKKVAAITESGP
eukprot:gene15692-21799_t